jgi:type II secretory pathway component PulF
MKTFKFLVLAGMIISILSIVVVPIFFMLLREAEVELPTPN